MSFALTSMGAVMAIGAGVKAVGGIVQVVDGGIQAKKAKDLADKAKLELDKQKDRFAQLDTSNPYLNLQNTYEDLTINQQEAQFAQQQSMQSQANIMQQMRGAAGGSGIAALAQTLANQGALDAQKAAATIGTQEQANQLKVAEEASKIQGLEREGELISRQAEFGKTQSLMGMAADELANQRDAQQQARQQAIDGVMAVGDAAIDFASSGALGGTGGTDYSSWRNKATDGGMNLQKAYQEYAGGLEPGINTGVLTFEEWKLMNKQNFAGNV